MCEMRKLEIIPDYLLHPQGSVLISAGKTRVLCTASVEDRMPKFIYGSGNGWLTAEYSMLPGSTPDRYRRERHGHVKGRTKEIQRLIGRCLRCCIDLEKLPEKTIWIDCDVLQADGGTRTASISGGFVALSLAVKKMVDKGVFKENPLTRYVGAISVGVVDGEVVLDLDYENDFEADVDMNVVMDDAGDFIEVQGTAEGAPFNREQMNEMVFKAGEGIRNIILRQKEIIDIYDL